MPHTNKQQKVPESRSALVAVSGGIDSICLLHMLCSKQQKNPLADFLKLNPIKKIEVAYIDHSQRRDTNLDLESIKALTSQFNIKLNVKKVDLPKKSSEDTARKARYKELNQILKSRNLDHLVTAHHLDDVIETAIINLIRGTGPRGLHSLSHHPNGIWRPFLANLSLEEFPKNTLQINKNFLKKYAKKNSLSWHEDSTNSSPIYLRNRIRSKLKGANQKDISKLLSLIHQTYKLNQETEPLLKTLILSLREQGTETYSTLKILALPKELQSALIHQILSLNGAQPSKKSTQDALDFIAQKQTNKVLQLRNIDLIILPKKLFRIIPKSTRN